MFMEKKYLKFSGCKNYRYGIVFLFISLFLQFFDIFEKNPSVLFAGLFVLTTVCTRHY